MKHLKLILLLSVIFSIPQTTAAYIKQTSTYLCPQLIISNTKPSAYNKTTDPMGAYTADIYSLDFWMKQLKTRNAYTHVWIDFIKKQIPNIDTALRNLLIFAAQDEARLVPTHVNDINFYLNRKKLSPAMIGITSNKPIDTSPPIPYGSTYFSSLMESLKTDQIPYCLHADPLSILFDNKIVPHHLSLIEDLLRLRDIKSGTSAIVIRFFHLLHLLPIIPESAQFIPLVERTPASPVSNPGALIDQISSNISTFTRLISQSEYILQQA